MLRVLSLSRTVVVAVHTRTVVVKAYVHCSWEWEHSRDGGSGMKEC